MELAELLALQRIKGIGNKKQVEIIKFLQSNDLSSFRSISSTDISHTKSQDLKKAVELFSKFSVEGNYDDLVEVCRSELKQWQHSGISVIIFGSQEYPLQLMELNDPPALLFCRGNERLLKASNSLAVVGTRENTKIGAAITRKTVEYFVHKGFCIISGLALGIDTIAHETALATSGQTIAVLVDVMSVSPSNNRFLAESILSNNGLLVSENPPNTKAFPGLFAKRDRIQAGLALAVFAIETSEDGGTMYAVNSAISLKREVYVPDASAAGYANLNDRAISGTQMLVSEQKAIPYTRESYEQITDSLTIQAQKINELPTRSETLL